MSKTITDRIDKSTHIPYEYLRVDPPAPKAVKIELTARCNFACTFCARPQMLRNQQDMDRSMYERICVDLSQSGVKELGVFFLGESFLVPWLDEAINFAKNKAKFEYVYLTTNGSIIQEEYLRKCFQAGLDSLKFSLNYCDEEQLFDIARVKKTYFRKIIDNLKMASRVNKEEGGNCGIFASFIEYDNYQSEKMEKIIEEVSPYVDEIYGLPLYNQAALVIQGEEEKGWKPTAGNMGRAGALVNPLPCWTIFTEGHITYEGQLSACCFDHDGRFQMGHLDSIPFMEAWHSSRFQELRRNHLLKNVTGTVCEKCIAYS